MIDVTKGSRYTAYCVQHNTLKLQLKHIYRNTHTYIGDIWIIYAWNLVLSGMKATLGSSYPVCAYARGICCILPKFGSQGEFSADTFQSELWECEQEKHHDKCSWMGLKRWCNTKGKNKILGQLLNCYRAIFDPLPVLILNSNISWTSCCCSQAKCRDNSCGRCCWRDCVQPEGSSGYCSHRTAAQGPGICDAQLHPTEPKRSCGVAPRCCHTAKTRG